MDTTKITYDSEILAPASDVASTVAATIQAVDSKNAAVKTELDFRLTEYFKDYFSENDARNTVLKGDVDLLRDFKSWLDGVITEVKAQEAAAAAAAQNTQNTPISTGGIGGTTTTTGDPESVSSEDPSTEVPTDPTTTTTPEPTTTSEVGPGGSGGGVAPVTPIADLTQTEIDDQVEGEHLTIGAIDDPLEQYNVSADDWDRLSDEDKEAIIKKLKKVGYSDADIEALENGEYNLPKVTMSKVANALEEALENDPDLRDILAEKYGFDIFYEDGTVNPTKLACALMIDAGKSSDSYDLINMLATEYGIDLVGMGDLNTMAYQIMDAMKLNPELREQLLAKYGFDIFNADGTVNIDKLRYALMIDEFNNADNLDVINTLYDCYGIDALSLGGIDDLSTKLAELVRSDPGMRQRFIDKYGFDIFNEDGTVNQERLRYALMLDSMDGDNNFDFISIMNGDNAAGLISNEEFDDLSLKLLSGLELDPELRQQLIDRYGFDIFNADGTINADRLRYALMMDRFSEEDDFNLLKFIDEFIGGYTTDEPTKKKGSAIPIIAGLGLAAASAGAGYTIYKKRKEEEEEDAEDDFVSEEDDIDI